MRQRRDGLFIQIRTLADAGVIKKDNIYKIPLDLLDEEVGSTRATTTVPNTSKKSVRLRTRTRRAATCRPSSSA
jgi:hypothetical protein